MCFRWIIWHQCGPNGCVGTGRFSLWLAIPYRRFQNPSVSQTSPSSTLVLFNVLTMYHVSYFSSLLLFSLKGQISPSSASFSITVRPAVRDRFCLCIKERPSAWNPEEHTDTNKRARALVRNWKAALLFGKRFRAQMKTIFHWHSQDSSCCAAHHRLSSISGKR